MGPTDVSATNASDKNSLDVSQPTCSRREVVCGLLALGCTTVLDACVRSPTASDRDDGVTLTSQFITLRLDRVTALRAPGSAYVIAARSVIVLRVADREYRAFSNTCTHAGCGIYLFDRDRMQCQCHGSEFDTEGRNVVGPAPLPLQRFAATLDASGTLLTIAAPG